MSTFIVAFISVAATAISEDDNARVKLDTRSAEV